jgi:hypothetical protein
VSAGSSPHAWFRKSIERRSLTQAEAAARELGSLDSEDALALVLLMRERHDARYERAAVRWLGRWLAENPAVGLQFAVELAAALRALQGVSPEVARAQAAVMLRRAGSQRPAEILERW